jgi:hypothetical protein
MKHNIIIITFGYSRRNNKALSFNPLKDVTPHNAKIIKTIIFVGLINVINPDRSPINIVNFQFLSSCHRIVAHKKIENKTKL